MAAVTGVSLWLSAGALAVVDAASVARVGALPPWWALGLLVAACVAGVRLGRLSLAHLWPLGLTALLWLPWLPLPVPAAFLIWLGPVAGLVWLAALAGVVVARWPRLVGRATAIGDHPRAPIAAALAAAVLYVAVWAGVAPRVPTGDEPHYLVITQSLLYDGDLRIENNHLRGDYQSYYGGGELRPDYLRRGSDGEIYSVHPLGVSVLVLPAFAVAGYGGVVVWLSILLAAGGLAVWHAAHVVTGSRRAAWIGWAAVMLTTPVVFHAFAVYPDGPGAIAVALATLTLVRLEVRGVGAVARWELAAAGTALAALPWLHTRFSIVAGVLGLALLLRQWHAGDRIARAVALLVVPALSAVGWLAHFWAIYGTPDPAAPYGGYTQSSLIYARAGLPGLLFDQQFGLLVHAPVLAVAIAGIVPLARARPRLAAEIGLVVATYWLAVASYAMWWGGYSAPARFAVATLPVLAVPAAWAWHAWPGRAARAGMGISLALSVLVVLTLCGVESGELLFEGRTGHAALLDWLNRTANLSLALPALHRGSVPVALAIVAAWGLVLSAALRGLAQVAARGDLRNGAWWLVSGATLGCAVMLAATLAWAIEGGPAVSPAGSQMVFLDRLNRAWLDVGVRLGPAGELLDIDALPPRLTLGSTVRWPGHPSDRPLLLISRVPAGTYELVVAGRDRLSGELTVAVGREERLIARWSLDGRPSPEPGWMLRLPVAVHSITVRGNAEARADVDEVLLRPLAVGGRSVRPDYSARASRSGTAVVYFLDDDAFVEEGGFWTRGGSRTEVVVMPEGATRPVLQIHGGRVASLVELRVGAWTWQGTLAPEETQEVRLPSVAAGDAVRVTINTGAGFRPFEHDPDNRDDRHLGVWVEVR